MTDPAKLIFSYTDPNESKLTVTDPNPVTHNWLKIEIEEDDAVSELDLSRGSAFDLHTTLSHWLGKPSSPDRELEKKHQILRENYSNRSAELTKAQDLVDDLTKVNTDLSQQIEELSVSPLDLAQQQRAKALSVAREVVEKTGGTHAFSKASSQASAAAVLSVAHFIVSGERDYVTTDGEYLLDDTRRALPAESAKLDIDAEQVGPGGPAPHSDLDRP